jgi:membrane protease YdiL (CAAX protease family)
MSVTTAPESRDDVRLWRKDLNLVCLIRHHPVARYFALAFGITWSSILLIVMPTGIPEHSADIARLPPLVFLAMIAGTSISTIVLTGIVDGQEGYRTLFSRLVRFPVDLRWYGALLIAPALLVAILSMLSLISLEFLPGIITARDKQGVLAFAPAAGLAAGLFEELGWTGFATPRILSRRSYLATALLIGVPWAIWHDLAGYWGGADRYGSLYLPDLLLWLVALPAYRFLIIWVYDHTGSLLLAILMHASFTGSQGFLGPTLFVAGNDVLWYGSSRFAVARRRDCRSNRSHTRGPPTAPGSGDSQVRPLSFYRRSRLIRNPQAATRTMKGPVSWPSHAPIDVPTTVASTASATAVSNI